MSQITIRQLPVNLERQIRRLANEKKLSLNKTIILLLKKSLGVSGDERKQRDFGDLAGKWDDEEVKEFEKNTQLFTEIESEVWSQ